MLTCKKTQGSDRQERNIKNGESENNNVDKSGKNEHIEFEFHRARTKGVGGTHAGSNLGPSYFVAFLALQDLSAKLLDTSPKFLDTSPKFLDTSPKYLDTSPCFLEHFPRLLYFPKLS